MSQVMDTAGLIKPSTAARMLGRTPQTVVGLCNAGKLPFVRTELGRLVDRVAVERLVAERAAATLARAG